jgi:prepilin-type N-terminal cleavage/methylation domain-containing protein
MKRGRRSKRHKERGFTLIESTLVIIIIGLLAIVAVPKILSTDKHEVRIAAHQITADMRYARGLAIANAKQYNVEFSKDGGASYTKYEILLDGDDTPVKSMEIPEEVTCIPVGLLDDNISFTVLGSADNSGVMLLLTATASGNYPWNINVVGATGMITSEEVE